MCSQYINFVHFRDVDGDKMKNTQRPNEFIGDCNTAPKLLAPFTKVPKNAILATKIKDLSITLEMTKNYGRQ